MERKTKCEHRLQVSCPPLCRTGWLREVALGSPLHPLATALPRPLLSGQPPQRPGREMTAGRVTMPIIGPSSYKTRPCARGTKVKAAGRRYGKGGRRRSQGPQGTNLFRSHRERKKERDRPSPPFSTTLSLGQRHRRGRPKHTSATALSQCQVVLVAVVVAIGADCVPGAHGPCIHWMGTRSLRLVGC